ncbi:ABC transporter permease [Streptomyces sp. NPDC056161]|uniref:ABC transporter permease n=1 Tax=Streptomyces sp. NPDC056161 TaxID=3345732 RepID=UPI0035DD51FB
MRDLTRLYGGLLPVYWRMAVARRARVWLNLVSLTFPLLLMWVWLQVTRQRGGTVAGLDATYFITYYFAAAVVSQVTTVSVTGAWDQSIRLGNLSAQLLRPRDPGHYLYCSELCRRGLAGLFGLPLLAVVVFLTADDGRRTVTLLMAPVSILIGFTLSFLMASAVGMLAFWMTQVHRVAQLWVGAGYILAGAVAPLRMMPDWVRTAASVLPFEATFGTPVEILAGHATVSEGLAGMATGVVWSVIAFMVYRLLWFRGLRRYSSDGA